MVKNEHEDPMKVKSRVTRRWAQKHPGTKSGKQEKAPSPKEAGSVQGRSTPSEAHFDPTVLATIVPVGPAL